MRLETKFRGLKTPVTIGSVYGEWRVCWLSGWTRYRLSYTVMVVREGRSHEFDDGSRKQQRRRECAVLREGASQSLAESEPLYTIVYWTRCT
jgi:hypothetical protein